MVKLFFKLVIVAILICLVSCSKKGDTAGGAVEDQGVVAIVNKTVDGEAQKGPFVNGSSVLLFEMDGSYAQTGKSFSGNISSNKGGFTLRNVSLVSQYATLVANGYYRNEVTGHTSAGTIQLNAISDLSQRGHVNVNLLTHLEYKRVLNLLDSGMTMSAAKERAESEVLKFFGFADKLIADDAERFEDLDIFSTGDGDAALLAISVLMQGELSEADLTERLTNVSQGLSVDKWNCDTVKTAMADWALGAPLARIRANVVGWKISDSVPAFETFVKHYWWNNYKLGNCSADNKNAKATDANKLSLFYGKEFVCNGEDWVAQFNTSSKTELNTWNGKNGSKNVFVNGHKFSNWYSTTDKGDPDGTTEFLFGNGVGADTVISEENIKACNGLCGTVSFHGWVNDSKSYLNWALAGFWLDTDNVGVDANNWKGLCMTYQSMGDGTMHVYLDTDYEDDADKLRYVLPNSSDPVTVDISWDDFSQEGWGVALDVHELVKNLVHVNLMFRGEKGTYLKFNILELGAYGKCGDAGESHFNVEKPFEAWNPQKSTRVMTNMITDTTGDVGKWYAWTEKDVASATVLNLGPDVENPIPTLADNLVQDQVIERCNGICGTVSFGDSLRKSAGDPYDEAPWAVEKVSLAQKINGEDVSSWLGFCMEYVSDVDMRVVLVSTEKDNNDHGWIYHRVASSKEKRVVDIPWWSFSQMIYAKEKIPIGEYIASFLAVFIFQDGLPFQKAYFNISKIGAYGTCY